MRTLSVIAVALSPIIVLLLVLNSCGPSTLDLINSGVNCKVDIKYPEEAIHNSIGIHIPKGKVTVDAKIYDCESIG